MRFSRPLRIVLPALTGALALASLAAVSAAPAKRMKTWRRPAHTPCRWIPEGIPASAAASTGVAPIVLRSPFCNCELNDPFAQLGK